ncbi:MAG: phosphatidylserine decarboxylase [Flavobacteriaceae bacterium]|nr:MAG: phosphatidylserine decarboxylase [Flavobacteriaceae bacterium]
MDSLGVAYHNSDPYFTVFKIPKWRAVLYKFLSVTFWGGLPSTIQRRVSALYSRVYNKPFTKYLIAPYVRYYYRNPNYLDNFFPPEGKNEFDSFQDFFTRRFKKLPTNNNPWVWPCEGLLCDLGRISELGTTRVKSDLRTVETIFGVKKGIMPAAYSFTNVFLHNKNYHRIHAPISGTITRIQHIPGDLIILRPWIYKQNPSLPAFRNERYNIDITDAKGRIWYLSVVGGPAVGTIKLSNLMVLGKRVNKLDELAIFLLGSTCCMAAPEKPRYHSKNTFVEVGSTY